MVIIFLGLITGRLATPCNEILCAVLDTLHISNFNKNDHQKNIVQVAESSPAA